MVCGIVCNGGEYDFVLVCRMDLIGDELLVEVFCGVDVVVFNLV